MYPLKMTKYLRFFEILMQNNNNNCKKRISHYIFIERSIHN